MKKASLMISLALSMVGIAVYAENAETFGDYTIHYNALSTESLSPDIAKTYGIRRSKNRGLVNIAVRHKQEDGNRFTCVGICIRGNSQYPFSNNRFESTAN